MDLKGKTAFVTGGSGDVGAAIANALARAGADVAVSYVGHRDGAMATANAVDAVGVRSLVVQLDQRDPASIDASVDHVINGLGRVDILVNNAGWNIGISFAALDELTADIWDRVHETNLRGPLPAFPGIRAAPSRARRRADCEYCLGWRPAASE